MPRRLYGGKIEMLYRKKTWWKVGWCFMLTSVISSEALAQPNSIIIFNLPEELSPSYTQKLPIFTDAKFHPNTSCILNYNPPTVLPINGSGPNLRNMFHKSEWSISTWVTNQKFPNLCKEPFAAKTANGLTLRDTAQQALASYSWTLSPSSLTMGINSRPFWMAAFGTAIPLFRSKPDLKLSWPNYILNKNMSVENQTLIGFDQIDSQQGIQLIFDGKLDGSSSEHQNIALPLGVRPPPGSTALYNPSVLATQLRISISVEYHLTPKEQKDFCTGASHNQICSDNGKYFHYMISIYDDRTPYQSKTKSAMEDIATHSAMFGEPLQDLMSNSQRQEWYDRNINPYQVPNQRFEINSNIYPLITQAILLLAHQRMPVFSSSYQKTNEVVTSVPPQMPNETNQQYLAHFAISSVNIGYEVSGLSNISFTIYSFKIIEHLKQ